MKILVISLLRLGDLLQQRPLLRSLRARYPQAEIHLLVNASVAAARNLCPEADVFHLFEREEWQEEVGRAEAHLLKPLLGLEEWVHELSREQFDEIHNWTHNRLSAHLAEALNAPVKKGLLSDGLRFRVLENDWSRFFNDRFGSRRRSYFHYTELLAGAFGLDLAVPPVSAGKGSRILIQPLTSDEKKNWSLSSWRTFVDRLQTERSDLQVNLLAAPFEVERLQAYFSPEEIIVANLTEVPAILAQTALLISGDTSIKHLAAQAGVMILELALGSADADKTASFTNGSYVVSSQVSCAPCAHSSPCRQLSHLCGESLPPVRLADAALALVSRDFTNAEKCLLSIPQVRVHRTAYDARLGWTLMDLRQSSETHAADLVEKMVWRLDMNRDSEQVAGVGTAARQLLEAGSFLGISTAGWQAGLTLLEKEQVELQRRLLQVQGSLAETARLCVADGLNPQRLTELRRELSQLATSSDRMNMHFVTLAEAGQGAVPTPFHFFGNVRKRIEETERRLQLRRRLIAQIQEAGGIHGEKSRNLSERGPETP